MRLTKLADTGYLYMLVTNKFGSDNKIQNNEIKDVKMLTIKINENFIATIPELQMGLFSHFDNLTFNIKQNNVSQFGLENQINVKFVKTGYMLEPLAKKIKLLVESGEGEMTFNLDQYFTGYRYNIDIVYSKDYKGNKAKSTVDDSNLIVKKPDNIKLINKYEFASIQEGDQTEKGLIYLGSDMYVYFD